MSAGTTLGLLVCICLGLPTAVSAKPKTPKIGTGVTIKIGKREKYDMVANNVRDPYIFPGAVPFDPVSNPLGGHRFVAIDVKIRNRGKRSMKYAFVTFTLLTTEGKTYNTTGGHPTGYCGDYSIERHVPRGQSRSACVLFEVPVGTSLGSFTWRIDNATTYRSARWHF